MKTEFTKNELELFRAMLEDQWGMVMHYLPKKERHVFMFSLMDKLEYYIEDYEKAVEKIS